MDMRVTTWTVVLFGVIGFAGCDARSHGPLGLDPLALEAGKGGNKPPKGGPTWLEGITGFLTVTPQTAAVEMDNKRGFHLRATPAEIRFDLSRTVQAGTGPCVLQGHTATPDDAARLLGLFASGLLHRDYVLMQIDRTGKGDHLLLVAWSDGGTYRGGISPPQEASPVDPMVVTAQENLDGSTTYRFTGGVLGIRDESGTPWDNITLHCPNLDPVELTVTRG